MSTPRQIILKYLNKFGAQRFDAIFLECKTHAKEPTEADSVKGLLNRLIEAGDIFTDGDFFSSHPSEIAPDVLKHFSFFVLKGVEQMTTMDEFADLSSDAELYAFLKKYAFIEDTNPTPGNILAIYTGELDGISAKITHSWHDPSGPFQNEPDIHKARLDVIGLGSRHVTY